MREVVVPVPSGVFNVVNFVLFDLLLVAAVFYLTADLAGLCNSSSALNKRDQRLFPFNPPVLGVGLTSTRRGVFYALAFVRLLAVAALLGTNFLSDGGSRARWHAEPALVRVPGTIVPRSSNDPRRRWPVSAVLARLACSAVSDDGAWTYYGELRTRALAGRNETSCETRPHLIKSSIAFENAHTPVQLRITGCAKNATKTNDLWRCDNARFSCMRRSARLGTFCIGAAAQGGFQFLCKVPDGNPEGYGTQTCQRARGLDWENESWMLYAGREFPVVQDAFHYLAFLGQERRVVRVATPDAAPEPFTRVHVLWFIVLGGTLVAISALTAVCFVLRTRGLARVANDEVGLGKLVSLTAAGAVSSGSIRSSEESVYGAVDRSGFLVQLKGSRVMATPNTRIDGSTDSIPTRLPVHVPRPLPVA